MRLFAPPLSRFPIDGHSLEPGYVASLCCEVAGENRALQRVVKDATYPEQLHFLLKRGWSVEGVN